MADLKLANSNSPEILPDVVERDCYLSVCLAGLPEKTLMVSLSVDGGTFSVISALTVKREVAKSFVVTKKNFSLICNLKFVNFSKLGVETS